MPFTWSPLADDVLRLHEILTSATVRPGEADWYDIPALVRKLDRERARAVVGYGSWYTHGLRKPHSFPDVYLIIDSYAQHYGNVFHAWMNRMLPPNVYFLWQEGDGRREIRGKYNVISAADLERECSPALRDVYNAGRLTKRVWVAWVRDEPTHDWLITQLVDAHCTLAPVVLGLLPERFGLDDFSMELLGLSYRAEPRLEGWEHVRALHAAHAGYYRDLHGALLQAFVKSTNLLDASAGGFRKRNGPEWTACARMARRLIRHSRLRGYLRWPRIILTEPNLVDLAVNEAERKAGVRIRVTPKLRRHPFLYGLPAFLRVLRQRNTQERIRKRAEADSPSCGNPKAGGD
jgi:hypothetical protein